MAQETKKHEMRASSHLSLMAISGFPGCVVSSNLMTIYIYVNIWDSSFKVIYYSSINNNANNFTGSTLKYKNKNKNEN